MMLGGANFIATDRRQAAPRGVDVLSARSTWPVRWTAAGCSAWMGRDGAFVPNLQLCRTITARTWKWLFPETDPSGALYGKPNDQYTNLEELLANPSRHGGMLRVDGQLVKIYAGPSSAWCDYNPGGTFVCLPGVHPPNATSTGQICYRLGVRCERLMLVQNATCSRADCAFDLSQARIRWAKPEHGSECSACQTTRSCLANDHSNGERPLLYPEGPDWAPSIVQGFLPEGAPVSGSRHWAVTPSGGPVPHAGGVNMIGGVTKDGSSVGGFLRKWEWHGRFWSLPNEEEYVSPAEHVARQLENQMHIPQRLAEMDVESDELPFPDGTAFDMVLLCRTWYWFKKRGLKLGRARHTRGTYCWDHVSKGYFNTQVCGHFFQIAPALPA